MSELGQRQAAQQGGKGGWWWQGGLLLPPNELSSHLTFHAPVNKGGGQEKIV